MKQTRTVARGVVGARHEQDLVIHVGHGLVAVPRCARKADEQQAVLGADALDELREHLLEALGLRLRT